MTFYYFFTKFYYCFLVLVLVSTSQISAQNSNERSPTVKNPVLISLEAAQKEISPGSQSELQIVFKIPYGFWLGQGSTEARTPPTTQIQMVDTKYVEYEKPNFPEPSVEGVPVHLGVTKVFKGEATVIVPFKIDPSAPEGPLEHKALITYTPGMVAGHLNTHVDEPYATTTEITKGVSVNKSQSKPSMESVEQSFRVKARELKLARQLGPFFKRLDESSATAKALHFLFNDPKNHGKHIQTITHPFLGTGIKNGESFGIGYAFMDLTREGIMTATLQFRGFYNDLSGYTGAITLVSCPSAYHNYLFDGQVAENGDKHAILRIENLVVGKNDRWGYQFSGIAISDSRFRFFGLGPDTEEMNGTNYTHEEFGGTWDWFYTPGNFLRIGLGLKVRSVEVKEGSDEIGLPFTLAEPSFSTIPGISGATVFGERFKMIYDRRNQQFNPTKGFLGEFTAEYNQLIENKASAKDDYVKFDVLMRQYFSTVDQRFKLVLRNKWTITTSGRAPFFDQAILGGLESLRAFEMGRFRGQNSFFASAELRFTVFNQVLYGIPLVVEVAPFLDTGQVFDHDGFSGQFNWAPGASLRILNRPNVGMIGNMAYGQDGLVFTGGVTLPF